MHAGKCGPVYSVTDRDLWLSIMKDKGIKGAREERWHKVTRTT